MIKVEMLWSVISVIMIESGFEGAVGSRARADDYIAIINKMLSKYDAMIAYALQPWTANIIFNSHEGYTQFVLTFGDYLQ